MHTTKTFILRLIVSLQEPPRDEGLHGMLTDVQSQQTIPFRNQGELLLLLKKTQVYHQPLAAGDNPKEETK